MPFSVYGGGGAGGGSLKGFAVEDSVRQFCGLWTHSYAMMVREAERSAAVSDTSHRPFVCSYRMTMESLLQHAFPIIFSLAFIMEGGRMQIIGVVNI